MRKALFVGSIAALATFAVLSVAAQAQGMGGTITEKKVTEMHPFAGLAPAGHVRKKPTPCEETIHTWDERFDEAVEGKRGLYTVLIREEATIVWRDGNSCNFADFTFIEKERFNVEQLLAEQELSEKNTFAYELLDLPVVIVRVRPLEENEYQALLSPSLVQVGREEEKQSTPPPSVDQSSVPVGDMLIGRYPPLFDFSNLRASTNN